MTFDVQPRLLTWLEKACQGVAVESLIHSRGYDFGYQVVIHNGEDGDYREEAVVASCGTEGEAELVAFALWALARRWSNEEGE